MSRGLDIQEHGPAAQCADDHKEHQQHYDDRQRSQQVLTGGDVLVNHQPAASPDRDDGHQNTGNTRDRGVLGLVQTKNNRCTDQKRHRGEQLVANTKERPDGANIARVNEVTPRTRKDHGGDDDAGPPLLVGELRPNLAHASNIMAKWYQ